MHSWLQSSTATNEDSALILWQNLCYLCIFDGRVEDRRGHLTDNLIITLISDAFNGQLFPRSAVASLAECLSAQLRLCTLLYLTSCTLKIRIRYSEMATMEQFGLSSNSETAPPSNPDLPEHEKPNYPILPVPHKIEFSMLMLSWSHLQMPSVLE